MRDFDYRDCVANLSVLLGAGGKMVKPTYPTGVENHGGNLRIVFHYKGRRIRESLGVPDTPKTEKLPEN